MDNNNSEAIFRTKIEPEPVEAPKTYPKNVPREGETKVEPLFTEYRRSNHHPFLVDYYQLGDTWKDKLGGFEKEVELIEGYFKDKIEQGAMQNRTELVEEEIKKIYKLCGIDKSERVTMQIEKLGAYIEFLKKTDNIEFNRYRYR